MVAGALDAGEDMIGKHEGTGSPQAALGRGDKQCFVAQFLAEHVVRKREMLRFGDDISIICVRWEKNIRRGASFGAVQGQLVAKGKKCTAERVALASACARGKGEESCLARGGVEEGSRKGVERAEER